MILLLDGYNILKKNLKEQFISEHERKQFINQLSSYAKKKKHHIIIVFDGGPFTWPSVSKEKNSTIVYSGRISADEYIKDYIQKNKNKDLLLISTDRELNLFAHEQGVDSLESEDFYQLLQPGDQKHIKMKDDSKAQKLYPEKIDEELDHLMQQVARDIVPKKEEQQQVRKRTHTSSKLEKKIARKIKKL